MLKQVSLFVFLFIFYLLERVKERESRKDAGAE